MADIDRKLVTIVTEAVLEHELLDELAVSFVESGWDVQHMLRLMVCSSTYRQNSNTSAGKKAAGSSPS